MKIIVNADDLGLTPEANEGVRRAWELGYLTQTTFVVNSDSSQTGAAIAHDLGVEDRVGLHLNIGEAHPLSAALAQLPRYVGPDGMLDFNSVFMEGDTYGYSPFLTYAADYLTENFSREVAALADEVAQQVERFCSLGFTPAHVDSHRNALVDLPMWLAARPILEDAGFTSIRPVFSSFATGDLYNKMYRRWLAAEHAAAGLTSVRYSSSVPKFVQRRHTLAPDEALEVYVHPIWVEGELIDNFTGGKLLADDIAALDGEGRTSYFELAATRSEA